MGFAAAISFFGSEDEQAARRSAEDRARVRTFMRRPPFYTENRLHGNPDGENQRMPMPSSHFIASSGQIFASRSQRRP